MSATSVQRACLQGEAMCHPQSTVMSHRTAQRGREWIAHSSLGLLGTFFYPIVVRTLNTRSPLSTHLQAHNPVTKGSVLYGVSLELTRPACLELQARF